MARVQGEVDGDSDGKGDGDGDGNSNGGSEDEWRLKCWKASHNPQYVG